VPELKLVEAADEHVELALVQSADDVYELRLRVMVGYYLFYFPTRNLGQYTFRFSPDELSEFLNDLDAGRESRHVCVDGRWRISIAIRPAPSSLPMRDVVLRTHSPFGIPAPPVLTTICAKTLDQLRDYRRQYSPA
jgi:hypothetical protein